MFSAKGRAMSKNEKEFYADMMNFHLANCRTCKGTYSARTQGKCICEKNKEKED